MNEMFNIVPMIPINHDTVYSDEHWDRIISDLLEQNPTGGGAAPARKEDIDALPEVKIDDSMLDDKGKAECIICQDNVVVTEPVTKLPCNHWFHKECIGTWLEEHDSCPVCRVSIGRVASEQPEPSPRRSSSSRRTFRRNSTRDGPSRSRSLAHPSTWFGGGRDGANERNEGGS
jgi:E3 ubiquitin-protein ligase RNF115/126